MENCFNVLKIAKIKSKGTMISRANHDFRRLPNVAPNADYSMSFQNEILFDDKPEDYLEAWEQRVFEIRAKGKKVTVRKNAVYAFDLMIGFSNEAKDKIDVDVWKENVKEWLIEEFGELNILNAVLHLDEATPHIHALIIPIDDREKLCAKNCLSSRADYYNLHDSLYKKNKALGLERGIKYSKPSSYTLKKFYAEVNSTPLPPVVTNEDNLEEFNEINKDFFESQLLAEKKISNDYKKEARVNESRLNEFKVDYALPIQMFNLMRQLFGDDEAKEKTKRIINLLQYDSSGFSGYLEEHKQNIRFLDDKTFDKEIEKLTEIKERGVVK